MKKIFLVLVSFMAHSLYAPECCQEREAAACKAKTEFVGHYDSGQTLRDSVFFRRY